jgi:proteasome lid subunit RPN8/RPN11
MIDKKIKNFIKNHSLKDNPKESCGFIVQDNQIFKCIPCENVSQDPIQNFKISSRDYLNIKNKYKKIFYIYHSHTNSNENFSPADISCSESLCLPIIMYNLNANIFKIHEPLNINKNYIGRHFEIGKYDCYTLIKDFLKNELNIDISAIITSYSDFVQAQNVFNQNLSLNFLEKKGFKMLENKESLEKNDILILQNNLGKHFALYLGDDKILHQPMLSFSKIENYCNFYRRHTELVYRKA